ncbi:MAG: hypothetical protein WEB89_05715 [Balneolales bacterium]
MTHLPEKKGFDLFNKVRGPVYHGVDSGFKAKLQSVNFLYIGSSLLQIITGLFLISLSVLQLIQTTWIGAVSSVLGATLTMVGTGLLYFAIKDRNSVDNLVKNTIKRVTRDHN